MLVLLERVTEAQRLATMQMKESDKHKKSGKRKDGGLHDLDAGSMFKRKYGKR